MKVEIKLKTNSRSEFIDITSAVNQGIDKMGISEGFAVIYCPHTTAAITINESADPDVQEDIIMMLDKLIPKSGGYKHREANSAAHIKSSIIGPSETVLIEEGKLSLGTWQGIFFCEFDGPRQRKVLLYVK